jgi:4-amino-4-deoxy-L-arabinose transferase-like glycosyltransferase
MTPPHPINFRTRIADILFVAALTLYVLAGLAAVPFHGDEPMQMAMAQDVSLMLNGRWGDLWYQPPVQPNSLQDLRLLNGTLNKDAIGLAWWLSGRPFDTLPGIYNWSIALPENRAAGNVPALDSLSLGRFPSALFGALGVVVLFWIGMRIGGRPMAYPAVLIYSLHPAILLNVRRAMMEGSLMLASLLVIGAAVWVAQRPTRRWIGAALLGGAAGLVIAAKLNGIVIVGGAFAGAGLAWLRTPREGPLRRRIRRASGPIVLAGLIMVALFFVFNPAYWRDPIGAGQAMIASRQFVLNGQITQNALVHQALTDRLKALLTQPFIAPPQYYESDTWGGVIDADIADYEDSTLSGWRWPPVVGALLTLLTVIGVGLAFSRGFVRGSDTTARVLVMCFAASVAGALASPLNWQRYYLPGVPVYILCLCYVPAMIRRAVAHRSVPDAALTDSARSEIAAAHAPAQ